MSEATVRSLAMPRTRPVAYRTRGRAHGPLVRLMSPSDLGEVLKHGDSFDPVKRADRGRSSFDTYFLADKRQRC
jgi:hypothetical protein